MSDAEARPVSLGAVGRSALILTGGAVVVQVIGFIRQLFLAAEVGLTSELDALLIGMAMPLATTGILVAGVSVALVPAYAAAKDERGRLQARRMVGTVLVWTGIASLVVSILLWVFADAIVAITGPGLAEAGTADDAVRYLRMLTPLTILGAISSIFFALCQAESLFPAMAISAISGPLIALAFMVYFWSSLALDGLVIGTLAGAVVSLSVVVGAT